jgi:molecular chaperone GrpE
MAMNKKTSAEKAGHKRSKRGKDAAQAASSTPIEEATETTAGDGAAVATSEDAAYWKGLAQRAQADFENTKKRLVAQQTQALERAAERVIAGLIPVMDDLDYGIAHAREAGNDLCAGLEAIRAKLTAVFAAEGVAVLDPTDTPFDHNTMQAVQMLPDATRPDQTVAQTLQKGYVLGSRVIRAAMVVVTTGGVTAGAGAGAEMSVEAAPKTIPSDSIPANPDTPVDEEEA